MRKCVKPGAFLQEVEVGVKLWWKKATHRIERYGTAEKLDKFEGEDENEGDDENSLRYGPTSKIALHL